MRILIGIILGIGVFFSLAGVVGMIRMPDALCRMQSSTNIATLGILSVLLASVICSAFVLKDYTMTIKLIVLGVFYIVTNPISSHALAKAACKRNEMINPVCDQYKEDENNVDDNI